MRSIGVYPRAEDAAAAVAAACVCLSRVGESSGISHVVCDKTWSASEPPKRLAYK
jgi:hypothetical protein